LGFDFAASLLSGNTESTFGIPQVQGLERVGIKFPTIGKTPEPKDFPLLQMLQIPG
jgi:hypothetical protein